MASHRSRLTAAIVDVPRPAYDDAVRFWEQALDRSGERDDADPDYVSFGQPAPGVELMVQAVGSPGGRVHLDIESDDVDAEVARLVDHGASVVARIRTWVVMRDPVGVVFCVVRVQDREAFEAHATTWD